MRNKLLNKEAYVIRRFMPKYAINQDGTFTFYAETDPKATKKNILEAVNELCDRQVNILRINTINRVRKTQRRKLKGRKFPHNSKIRIALIKTEQKINIANLIQQQDEQSK